jgi:predicted MFS family arabinose efflux permease
VPLSAQMAAQFGTYALVVPYLSLNSSALYVGMSLGAFLSGTVLHRFGAGALPIASLVLVALSAACFAGSRQAQSA